MMVTRGKDTTFYDDFPAEHLPRGSRITMVTRRGPVDGVVARCLETKLDLVDKSTYRPTDVAELTIHGKAD